MPDFGLIAVASSVVGIFGAGAGWGHNRSKLAGVERRIGTVEADIKDLEENNERLASVETKCDLILDQLRDMRRDRAGAA